MRERLRTLLSRLRSESVFSLALIGVALGLLPFLAILQYRWIGKVSEAERERLGANLNRAVAQLKNRLDRELAAVHEGFLADRHFGDQDTFEKRAARYVSWMERTQHRGIVREFYLTEQAEPGPARLFAFDAQKQGFEPVRDWPDALADFQETATLRGAFHPALPAMVAPRFCRGPNFPGRGPGRICGWAIAELDTDYIGRRILTPLVERLLAADYETEVIEEGSAGRVIYRSSAAPIDRADLTETILQLRPEPPSRRGGFRPPGPPPPEAPAFDRRPPRRGLWTLRVKHRSGSLEAAVEQNRRLNLGVSLAILAVLAGCTLLLHRSASRERKLAQLQMDFVAGVSHELRTPLSAARALSENLADGLVHPDPQVRRYGRLLHEQARGLSEMVDQVLRLAGIQSDRVRYDLKPVAVGEVLDRAVQAAGQEIEQAHCRLERETEDHLPEVMADAASLSHCVRNLLSNAVKYGHNGGAIKLSARRGPNSFSNQVWISVEDHGPGIEPAELRKVFQPFYRGKRAIADQVHGMGLGLALVKRIVEAHAGAVELDAAPGEGCRFTLRIPIAQTTG